MTVSEITAEQLAVFIRTDKENQDEINLLSILKASAVSFFCSETGMREADLNDYEDITFAIMILVQDMYDNRCLYIEDGAEVNKTAQAIIDHHRRNFV